MKIALIGANGFVGKAIARELLDRGHFVTAISRHPEILEAGGAGDRTGGAVAGGSRGPAAGGAGDKTGGAVAGGSRGPAVGGAGDRTGGAVAGGYRGPADGGAGGRAVGVKGDVFDVEQMAGLLKGHDAIVSAYKPGVSDAEIYEPFVKGAKAILEAVKKSGVKRLIVIGGAGSLYIQGVQLVDSPQFPAAFKNEATAARDNLNEIKKEKDLDWTFFSPAIMMNHQTAGERRGKYRLGLENPVFDEKGMSLLSVEDLAVVIADELENPKHIRQRFTAAY